MSVVRISEFESKSSKVSESFEYLESLIPFITSSKGCLSCSLLKNNEKENQFVIIETWKTIEDHQSSVKKFSKTEMKKTMEYFSVEPKGSYYVH